MNISIRYFIKEKDLVTRRVPDETIVVPVKSNVGDLDSIYTLNEVGSTIWELIDGKRSVSEIAKVVSNAYEVTPQVAEKDMIEFLNSLKVSGLIRSNTED